jgi:V-type H+-transporting ATPase subunit a
MQFLLYVALISLPLMLLVNPCVTSRKHKPAVEPEIEMKSEAELAEERAIGGDKKMSVEVLADALLEKSAGNHNEFGELFIHQMIETIEFVLNCISNTASYLRLWALSLAHSELADVFLTQILGMVWKMLGPNANAGVIAILTFLLGFAFMLATVSILICMDFVECLLHTQRLHWVEFMSKFYGGGGYAYQPFSFREVFKA